MFCPKQLIIYLTESKTQSKEKEFTSDASHEGPVDDYKGTLEVLIGSREILQSTRKKLTFVFMK
jgi:hypothetical protein